MSVFTALYTILIGPLQLVFEIIFSIANKYIGHPGLAIIVLSLLMNFLVLPLYRRADIMQEEARDTEEKLKKGVEHIKKSFSGDEKMMILQTYYKQNNYKPTDALNGAVSLLLEIPFFMAAYNFLSHLDALQNVSFGPIANLGMPDALIQIGTFDINVLPILMTVINIISSSIYLKGFPVKTKIQMYGVAVVFLVFLYTSPAGLVFYWTLNNVFSLCKNIYYRLKSKYAKIDTKVIDRENEKQYKVSHFLLGALFLTILIGGLIPSTIIAASPQEFMDLVYFYNPLGYIGYSLCYAIGTFLVWMGVFYWIASPKGKVLFDKIIWIMCVVTVVNYMFFGTELGILFSNLQYEKVMKFEIVEILINIVIILVVTFVICIILKKWRNVGAFVLLSASLALGGMSIYNVNTIKKVADDTEIMADAIKEATPHFSLSKEGKNVVVIMMDRAMGQYIPYIFNDVPGLKEKYEGFTYYSNVISFAGFTNFSTPTIFGGYEYTPIEMNKRDTEPLVSKHNEALKLMPVLFDENDYKVTVMDPTYANYYWIPDLTIYDEYPDIDKYITSGLFGDNRNGEYMITSRQRNFFCFSIMKTLPLFVQELLYDDANYNRMERPSEIVVSSVHTTHSMVESEGISGTFMDAYNVLLNMSNITNITEDSTNTFMMMTNNLTHEPMMLQEPMFEPSQYVDNTEFYQDVESRFTYEGRTLIMDGPWQVIHYQTNVAALMLLGDWLDYLRENDVYDNTRIILVSDHGNTLYHLDELLLPNGEENIHDVELYYPLMMVKDFDCDEFTTSDEFMTLADVPTMTFDKLIENPINPFTGKEITNVEKTAHDQYVITSKQWDISTNCGNTYIPSAWYAVKDNLWVQENWRYLEEVTTIPEEAK